VLKAGESAALERRKGLQELVERYWKPLYFFVRRKGNGVEASKDIVQGFFATMIERESLRHVDRPRGRFRTFLLAALEHFMADEHARTRALKRGGGQTTWSLDAESAEAEAVEAADDGLTPERSCRRAWAIQVMARALHALQASLCCSGLDEEFDAFRAHLASTRPEGVSYQELADRLGVSVDSVRGRIRRVRARYREAILAEIRAYSRTQEEALDELKDLLSAFS
jgi:RNA polymerase sigma-70 factor (ECF subfamily)